MERRSVDVMGTVVSLAVRGAAAGRVDAAWTEVVADLRWVDEVFSTYRPDSVINRWGRGELALADAPPEVGEVLGLASAARDASHGAFDIEAVRSPYGGGPDPSGVVKGWAVQRASSALEAMADTDYCLSAGGDLICRTRREGAGPWRIGIEDPRNLSRTLAVVPVFNGAVATSGTAHRGAHLVDPSSGAPAAALLQVTVVGPDLPGVDIDATASFVLGDRATAWLESRDRTGLLVGVDGATSLFGGAVRTSVESSSPQPSWSVPSSRPAC